MYCNKCQKEKDDCDFGCMKTRCKKCVADQKREYNHNCGKCKNYKGNPKENLKDHMFGNLIVRNWNSKQENGYSFWDCECACGKIVEVIHGDLVSGRKKSCGCLRKKKGHHNHLWKGCGKISGDFWSKVVAGAAIRNLDFKITIQDAWNLFISQNSKCKLSGWDLSFSKPSATASLDRIDSGLGYTIENLQWVHKDINRMKNKYSQEWFLLLCETITDYQRSFNGK
jgi:hypothetical protein